jgi:hypothetical protein
MIVPFLILPRYGPFSAWPMVYDIAPVQLPPGAGGTAETVGAELNLAGEQGFGIKIEDSDRTGRPCGYAEH